MSLLEKSTELLEQQLLIKNQPYTYKLLSRELNIHVKDAKKLLYSFYLKNKDLVIATYVIIGKYKDLGGLTIKITEDLEKKSKFEDVHSIAVYSLAPKNSKINEVIKLVHNKLQGIKVTEDKLETWGVIKGPEILKSTGVTPQTSIPDVRPQSAGSPPVKKETKSVTSEPATKASSSTLSSSVSSTAKTELKKDKEFPDMGSLAARMLARNKRPVEVAAEETQKKQKQSTFGRSNTKNEDKDDSRKSKTEPTPKKSGSVEIIGDEEEIPVKKYAKNVVKQTAAPQPPRKKTAKELELEAMFDSDDDFEEEEKPKKEVPEKKKNEQEKEQEGELTKDELAELEELDEMIESEKASTEPEEIKDDIDEEEEIQEAEKEDASKDETVKQYYDEDGFLVTEKKPVAQSSKPKPNPKAKPAAKNEENTETKKRPAAAPAGGKSKKGKGGSGGQQSSLLSFFGKKTR